MIGRHKVAKNELQLFKSLLDEYAHTPPSDERSKGMLCAALGRLGSTLEIILMDVQDLNEESPANNKPE
ncbi:hypothetical protein [Pseudomonas sp. FYR_5]|uniref:hypothetical protein n=1 Tax=Pseudomonas sp. FYR_5 TaxID=3367173 RepID=UPI00370B383F